MKGLTMKVIKGFAVANAPALIAAGVALLLVVLASFQGCALRETRKELQVKERKLEKVDDELTVTKRDKLQLTEKLQLQAEHSRTLTEQLQKARKQVAEPVFNRDGDLVLLPGGQPAYRYTDESSENTDRRAVDVYQLRLAKEAERAEQAELLAEQRRQAFVESQATVRHLEQTKAVARRWSASLGPMVGGGEWAGTWFGRLGYRLPAGPVDLAVGVAYPVAPAGGLLGNNNPDAGGPATWPVQDRPWLPTFGVGW